MNFKEFKKNSSKQNLEAARRQLHTVSFLELINTSAGIDKLLLAGKERMTFGADIYLNNVNVFGSSGFKGLTASALHLNYLVIRMNVLLHIKHLVLIVTSLFFRCRMLLYYRFRYKSTIFRLFLFLRKKTLPTGCKIVTKTLDYFCAIYYTL